MKLEWVYSLENISLDELSELYNKTLGNKSTTDLKAVFTNSIFKCFVFSQSKLIAAGRSLADGIDCSYICDVAVLPEFQRLGIGKNIISKLVKLSAGHNKIILYAVPGKEAFYKKLGFKKMNTAMAIFKNQHQAVKNGLINET